tara:strand:+ start:8600 stop:9019 length:420 start_codon:yes stop_codon:yes gene_type:complete
MKLKNKTITKGFVLAGLMNLSVLLFSRFFTNPTIPEFDPEVMSNFGLLMIVIWGVAYISVSKKFHEVKWLVAVFVIEKFIYGYIWIRWMLHNNISDVYGKDRMAGVFFSIYGINDWLFFVFFLFIFIYLSKEKKELKSL